MTMSEKTAELWGWERPSIGMPADEKNRMDVIQEADRKEGEEKGGKETNENVKAVKDYYKAAIKADRKVFADEVVKHDMLSLLWKQTTRWNYEVIAFTLLDDELHLILARCGEGYYMTPEKKGRRSPYDTDPNKGILEDLRRESRALYGRSVGKAHPVLRETSSWEKLECPSEVLRECCDIHQMPVRNGYVSSASEYWWSSYISYRGRYYWKFLNCRELLSRFSSNMAKASAMFCKEQTSYSLKEEEGRNEKS